MDTYQYMKEHIENKGYRVIDTQNEIVVEKGPIIIIYRKDKDECFAMGVRGSFISSPLFLDCSNLFKAYRRERCEDVS